MVNDPVKEIVTARPSKIGGMRGGRGTDGLRRQDTDAHMIVALWGRSYPQPWQRDRPGFM
jgi:hypothetical protein